MNEREFAAKRRAEWNRLEAIVSLANSRSGIKSLPPEAIRDIGPLYRRVSSDLARVRRHALSPDLAAHLNGLVGRTNALLYQAETSQRPLRSVALFYLFEFPAVLQRRWKSFFAAFALTLFGGLLAYWMVINRPSSSDLFIPPGFKSSMDVWKSKKTAESAHLEQSGYLMTHNFEVGMTAFALGIAFVPDVVLMFTNGALLGAAGAIMTQNHAHSTFWPGILPHGIAELTAIFVCGGAGFVLAMALILPGRYSRQDALRLAAEDALKMVLGTIPLFIFAGMIEGMFSHLDTTAAFRYSFAGLNGTAWYLYLFLPRKRFVNAASYSPPQPGQVALLR